MKYTIEEEIQAQELMIKYLINKKKESFNQGKIQETINVLKSTLARLKFIQEQTKTEQKELF